MKCRNQTNVVYIVSDEEDIGIRVYQYFLNLTSDIDYLLDKTKSKPCFC